MRLDMKWPPVLHTTDTPCREQCSSANRDVSFCFWGLHELFCVNTFWLQTLVVVHLFYPVCRLTNSFNPERSGSEAVFCESHWNSFTIFLSWKRKFEERRMASEKGH